MLPPEILPQTLAQVDLGNAGTQTLGLIRLYPSSPKLPTYHLSTSVGLNGAMTVNHDDGDDEKADEDDSGEP